MAYRAALELSPSLAHLFLSRDAIHHPSWARLGDLEFHKRIKLQQRRKCRSPSGCFLQGISENYEIQSKILVDENRKPRGSGEG